MGSDRPVFSRSVYGRAEMTVAARTTRDFLQESLHLAGFTIHKRFRYRQRRHRSLIYNEEAARRPHNGPKRQFSRIRSVNEANFYVSVIFPICIDL